MPPPERRAQRGVAPAECWNWGKWGLTEYKWKGYFLGWFVGLAVPVQEIFILSLGSPCRYRRFLSCLGCASQASTKYFFPHRTLFHYMCWSHRSAIWAGSRAWSPVSYSCVSGHPQHTLPPSNVFQRITHSLLRIILEEKLYCIQYSFSSITIISTLESYSFTHFTVKGILYRGKSRDGLLNKLICIYTNIIQYNKIRIINLKYMLFLYYESFCEGLLCHGCLFM